MNNQELDSREGFIVQPVLLVSHPPVQETMKQMRGGKYESRDKD